MFYSIQKRDDVLGFNRNGQPEPKLNLPDWTVGADANRLSEIDLEMLEVAIKRHFLRDRSTLSCNLIGQKR